MDVKQRESSHTHSVCRLLAGRQQQRPQLSDGATAAITAGHDGHGRCCRCRRGRRHAFRRLCLRNQSLQRDKLLILWRHIGEPELPCGAMKVEGRRIALTRPIRRPKRQAELTSDTRLSRIDVVRQRVGAAERAGRAGGESATANDGLARRGASERAGSPAGTGSPAASRRATATRVAAALPVSRTTDGATELVGALVTCGWEGQRAAEGRGAASSCLTLVTASIASKALSAPRNCTDGQSDSL